MIAYSYRHETVICPDLEIFNGIAPSRRRAEPVSAPDDSSADALHAMRRAGPTARPAPEVHEVHGTGGMNFRFPSLSRRPDEAGTVACPARPVRLAGPVEGYAEKEPRLARPVACRREGMRLCCHGGRGVGQREKGCWRGFRWRGKSRYDGLAAFGRT